MSAHSLQSATCSANLAPSLNHSLESDAFQVAIAVAERLRDPERVKSVATARSNINPSFGSHPWDETSLSHGYPGVALLFAELHALNPGAGWDRVAHEYLTAAAKALSTYSGAPPSLFSGLGAVAFAALASSCGRTRYTKLLDQLDLRIIESVSEILAHEEVRQREQSGAVLTTYDAIVGLSGTGRYLLHSLPYQQEEGPLRKALLSILNYLVELAQPIKISGLEVPGWYVSAQNQILESDRKLYPNGNFNCGLAHGIPGPLALLSLTALRGLRVAGQEAAIRNIVDWLLRWEQTDEYGTYWPDRVSWEDEAAGTSTQTFFRREAWCYGTPGVARPLWLAGMALGDQEPCDGALRGMNAVFRRPQTTWNIDGPTFCHGRAGLLQITNRFAQDTGNPTLVGSARELAQGLIKQFDPDSPFGYRDLLPAQNGPIGLDTAGLLEGAGGVALALLSAVDDRVKIWDKAFLIA